MPRRIVWTEQQDATIKRMRGEAASWDAIAVSVGVTRWTVIERGRHIGARLPEVQEVEEEDPDREPLPPGHKETWGLITKGTVLEGSPYPFPVWQWVPRGKHFISAGE